MESVVDKTFPSEFLVPKNETGVLNFLSKYPEYNGRDVTIAIFDSGVDPKAAGLQCTPDGAVKVIGRYDCSGCGDIDTSRKVTATNGIITGLSGRSLKLTEFMKTKNILGGEYRVGLKSLYDLYPMKVREKLNSENKFKSWDDNQKKAMAEIHRELDVLDGKSSPGKPTSLHDKLKKEDLENALDFLTSYEKKFSDLRTTYDCILFPTSGGWYLVIDTTETGDLDNALLIGEYSKTYEIKSIDELLSVSMNVHDSGDILELVGMCSSHGTHVASIASGYRSDNKNKEMDGVAPNAKIISLTIGDGRLGSMETGTALVRAMIKVMELCNSGIRIDIINMSYGEHAHWSNSGRIGELMNEVVNKYGVVWIASAGNHGPALCTIGTPPDISQPIFIGVGAYVSPGMMEAEYALRQKLPANVYTWTSRDPCIDGGQGVTVCAPGAAIAAVPEFTLTKQQLMNGTSMAAPHVAGAVALMISGLKHRGIPFSPYSIKRALWNTATKLDYVDKFAQGNGLLNVEKAFEYLIKYKDAPENRIRFSIGVGSQYLKGIHIRRGVLNRPEEYNVTIEPVFFNEKDTDPKDKINFNMRLTLVASEPWVQLGSFLDLCYSPRSLVVKIDPTRLPQGIHTASIKAYDSACVDKGTVFEIPINVVQPIVVDTEKTKSIRFKDVLCKPNTILRHFILVPNHATWAVLKIKSADAVEDLGGKFLIHTMQIMPLLFCKAMETLKVLPVSNENETVHAFKCEENNILEVCVAKYWSNFGETHITYSIEFHGVHTTSSNVMHSAHGIHRIDITTLYTEELNPTLQLKKAIMILKPAESKISPLTSRDVIPQNRQIYQNVLNYNLHLTKGQEVAFYVPLLSNVLYESEFESQFWMLFDPNKMMIACGDAYSNNSFVKIERGDYTIRLQIRHEKKDLLEKVNEAVMLASFKISSPITMDIYRTYSNAISGGKKLGSFQLQARQVLPIYIAPISQEKLSKANIPSQCSWLDGVITYARDDPAKKADVNSFEYVLTEGPAVKKPANSPKEVKSKLEEYKEGLRDLQISTIPKLESDKAFELYTEILKTFNNYCPAHIAYIQNIEPSELKSQFPYYFVKSLDKTLDFAPIKHVQSKIIELTSNVINNTDIESLLSYYGLKSDSRQDAQKIKAACDKQRATLLEAYTRRTVAMCKLIIMTAIENKETATYTNNLGEIDNIFTEVGKFVDYTDSKVIHVSIWHAYMHRHYGRMCKHLNKIYDEKLQKEVLEELLCISKEKRWDHMVYYLEKAIVSANPLGYRVF